MGQSENDLAAEIIARAEEVDFSGVISLYRDRKALLDRGFGLRHRAEGLPNERDTRFGIASGTKLFTALGIGVLMDRGEIGPDTKVGDLDKSWCSFIDGEATIQQLLAHTSGMFDYYDEELATDFDDFYADTPWHRFETPADYLPLFTGQPKFTPGERFSYSNGGYVFLGIIIEKITGGLYRDFIQDNVLEPAGMGSSGFFALDKLPRNTAMGYRGDGITTNIFNLPIRGGGDGGMFTTADDLRSFWESFFAGKILSKEMTDHFMKTQWKFNETSGYGSGIYKDLDDSMFSIMGGDAGVGFDSRYLVEQKITVSILSNITDGENEMRKFILQGREKLC